MTMNVEGTFHMPLPQEEDEVSTEGWERPMSPEAFAAEHLALLRNPNIAEREEMRAFHTWFVRRCPTARERILYIERKSRQAMAFMRACKNSGRF